MFRQRTSAAKPGDELLANFRQQFPQLHNSNANSAAATAAPVPSIAAPAPGAPVAPHRPQSPQPQQQPQQQQPQGQADHGHLAAEGFGDQDPTPRGSNDPWRFTPSLLDASSFNYGNFTNAPSGYYTPTPGGTGTLFHPQAGDLHTPSLALGPGLSTPLSMPTSADAMHAGPTMVDMSGFQPLQTHQIHHFNPFIQAPPPQQGFAPSTFVHQDTGYETMDQDGSPIASDPSDNGRMGGIDSAFQQTHQMGQNVQSRIGGMHMAYPLPLSAEKFRFHCTLNAPTAMIKQADEIPITYLNKGQAYSLTVADAQTSMPLQPGTRYRTFVRVSFEDDEQRQKPGVCWGLWKEGRGTNEAHHRGGKLQAVEYVEAGQPASRDDQKINIEVESSSFDGFSLVWTPGMNAPPELSIAVRFNFLSTDFSHSKGVKGIPVRLCAKTVQVGPDAKVDGSDTDAEVCFCKVKLFRDHGAERKLSNDVAHVKKSIDKLKQQITQAESGMKDFGKRKRSSVAKAGPGADRPGKVQKHKRTWSISSASSSGGGNAPRMTLEEDLHFKLQTLQDMFTSTRPVSLLYLRGEELDDPDKHPVALPGNQSPEALHGSLPRDSAIPWQVRSERSSIADPIASPSPSSLSLVSQTSAAGQRGQWQQSDGTAAGDTAGKDQGPARIRKVDADGNFAGWVEATGVDKSYRPPPDHKPKPVACFYVLNSTKASSTEPVYHQAVYLMRRSLEDFTRSVASKWGLEPSRIFRTVRVLENGLEVLVDDDVIQQLREGQDMILECEDVVNPPPPVKREWEMAVDSNELDENHRSPSPPPATGIVLRLRF